MIFFLYFILEMLILNLHRRRDYAEDTTTATKEMTRTRNSIFTRGIIRVESKRRTGCCHGFFIVAICSTYIKKEVLLLQMRLTAVELTLLESRHAYVRKYEFSFPYGDSRKGVRQANDLDSGVYCAKR